MADGVYNIYVGPRKDQLYLQSNPNGEKIEVQKFTTERLNLGSTSLEYGKRYYWRVETCHSKGGDLTNICIKSDIDSFQVYKKNS